MSDPRPLTRLRVRLLLLGLVTCLWVLAVAARLAFLTIVQRDELHEKAELQYQHSLKLDAARGTLLDRNGRELAMSVEVESIYVVPKAFTVEARESAARELATCLRLPTRRVASRLEGDKSFVWLERKAMPEEVRCVRALNLAGVGFLPETRRFYPKRYLASQVLGYVGLDNEGMSGVEYALEAVVRGEPGRRIIWTDALRRPAGSRVEKGSVPGRSAFLTIDENLQYIAETELAAAVRESRAGSGIAILMRPETGEILAMASHPSFNPNRYGDYPQSHWRNRSVTDVYEPGSTFKIVAASAALEEGVTAEDERIDCGGGSIRVADRLIRDHSVFDVLTFREVVEHSSNVGMIRIGQRLGRERLAKYIRAFGFGDPTGVELPAESRGILKPTERWGPVTLASISFGQEISVTPLQMVTAANVLASGGYLMRPKLVLGYAAPDGTLSRTAVAEPVRRVLSEETVERMRALLMGVVDHGTGKRAQIPGYVVAGKTGTAQKAVPGGYSKTDYIASFVGFVPAERPALTAIVILDSPEGDHSGSRAAGVFAAIASRSLHYLGVPAADEPLFRVAQVWPQTPPILESRAGLAVDAAAIRGVAASATLRTAVVPEDVSLQGAPRVEGLAARDALARFVARGLVPEVVGAGWVVEQHPAPGEVLPAGERAKLVLARSRNGFDLGSEEPRQAGRVVRVSGDGAGQKGSP